MLSSLFSSSNEPQPPEKKESSSFDVGSFVGSILSAPAGSKAGNVPKKSNENRASSSKPGNELKSGSLSKDEPKIKKKDPDSSRDKSRESKVNGHSSRSEYEKKDKKSNYDEYNPLSNDAPIKKKPSSQTQRDDPFDIPIKKKPAESNLNGDSSPRIKKREPSSPKIKKREPSSPKIKKVETPTSKKPEPPTLKPKPTQTSTEKKKETPPLLQKGSKPIQKPVSSQNLKKPSPSQSTARPNPKTAPSHPSSRDPSGKRAATPVTAQAKGKEYEKSYAKLTTPVLLNSQGSKPSGSSKPLPSVSQKIKPSSSGQMSSKQPLKPGSTATKPSSGNGQMIKKSTTANSALSKAAHVASKNSALPSKQTIHGKPISKPIPGKIDQVKKSEPFKPRSQMGPPPNRVAKPNPVLGKRPLDKPSSKFEPEPSKKTKMSPAAALRSIFKGPSKKGRFGEDDEYDEEDSFIASGDEEDEDELAKREMAKLFGGYRNRVKKTRHLEDDMSDMEAGFDEIQQEEQISKFIGQKEDIEQLKFIQKEREDELKKEKLKRKKLQID